MTDETEAERILEEVKRETEKRRLLLTGRAQFINEYLRKAHVIENWGIAEMAFAIEFAILKALDSRNDEIVSLRHAAKQRERIGRQEGIKQGRKEVLDYIELHHLMRKADIDGIRKEMGVEK
jgi:hypothetical protein